MSKTTPPFQEINETIFSLAKIFANITPEKLTSGINKSLSLLGSTLGCDRVYIFEYDFQNYTATNTFEWCREGIEPQIDNLQNTSMWGMEDWIYNHKQGMPMRIPKVKDLPDNVTRSILEPQGIKSLLAVPIMSNEILSGFIGFDWVRNYHEFLEEEEKLLKLFADLLEAVNKRINLQRSLEKERIEQNQKHLFQKVFESRGSGYWMINLEDNTSYLSDQFKQFLGYPREMLKEISSDWKQHMHSDDVPTAEEALRQNIVSQGKKPIFLESRFLNFENKISWALAIGNIVEWGATGEPKTIAGIVVDTSERKEKEYLLKKIKRRQKIGNLIEEFAHNLNNYLSPTYMQIEFLRRILDNSKDTEISETLSSMENCIDNSIELITSMRSQLAGEELKASHINPHKYLKKIVKSYKFLFPSTLSFSTNFCADQVTIYISPEDLNQVVSNLLINAKEAIEGTGTILIETKVQKLKAEENNSFFQINIKDTGVGIPKSQMKEIFKDGFSTKRKEIESGLGLSSTKKIVEKNGGSIKIWSELGVGTQVSVILPLSENTG